MRPGVASLAGQPMRRTLAENRRETVVMRIFVVLDSTNPAEELVRAPVVYISDRTARLRLVVIEIPIKVDRVRPQILQLCAGSFPQLLPPGEVPLIQLLHRQVWPHGDR